MPAASAWVRTAEDAHRYYLSSADEIFVRVDGENVALSALDPIEQKAWNDKFLARFLQDGWLPYTERDALEGQKKAEALAAEMGGGAQPIIGVAFDDSSKNVFWKGYPRK